MEPTQKEIRERLYYEDGGLYWRYARKGGKAGDRAGCESVVPRANTKPIRYRKIGLSHVVWNEHRIIWIYHYGAIPKKMQIDHINGDGLDNHIENLRLATIAENNRNKPLTSRNKTGFAGVEKHSTCNRWVVRISMNGKRHYVGLYKTKEQAIAARKAAEVKYGFHPNHGLRQPTAPQE